MVRILNLYAGIGGNRKLWGEVVDDLEVTAIEIKEEIAKVYQDNFPQDCVVIGDAHEFLKENYKDHDFIWSSPPCPSHSQLLLCNYGRGREPKYPDMRLYQEIIFLKAFFDGKWAVENVNPHYKPLIRAQKVDRHLIWSNFFIPDVEISRDFEYSTAGQADINALEKWLDIELGSRRIYIRENHDPAQILRNCVHPKLGKHILECAFKRKTEHLEAFMNG